MIASRGYSSLASSLFQSYQGIRRILQIVNVISYYSLLYIHYPAKLLFRKVMGGMGSIILACTYVFDLINFCINPAIDTEK